MTIALVAATAGRTTGALLAACGDIDIATCLPPGALRAIDLGARVWARRRTDRRYLTDFWLRRAIDASAAHLITRQRPQIVIAHSLAARRTFAAARAIGAATVLYLDLPLFRAMHRDLDRAAEMWPARRFLRRFRAPSWAIARQEAERALADLVIVRGAYARALCLADGISPARLAVLPSGLASPHHGEAHVAPAPPRQQLRLRLAGLAAARHGIDTALEVARALGATLVVRLGEGSEPADLARRPGIAIDNGSVDAVICPAVCEAYPPELGQCGVPAIASPMASLDGTGPDPFDPVAFAAAVQHALTAPIPAPGSSAPLLGTRITALLTTQARRVGRATLD